MRAAATLLTVAAALAAAAAPAAPAVAAAPLAPAATVALAVPAAPASAGQSPRVENARLETRSAASGLAAVVHAEVAARPGPAWLGWSVPSVRDGSSCCWTDVADAGRGCRGCRLEGKGGSFTTSRGDGVRLEGPGRVRVLLRAEGGRVGKIRVVSEDCPLDVSGLPLVWIHDARPADSVALLTSYVGRTASEGQAAGDVEADRGASRLDEGAMSAIAFHADPSADDALEHFAAASQPRELRRKAIFWLGHARGARGSAAVKRILSEDGDRKVREHAVFALHQSREPGAVDAIVEAAKRDADPHVRGQALFWLAQTASRRAPDAIRAALEDDPEVGAKKKAVFALSQLPKDEGVPLLIGVAETHASAEVRKQAMFWLGQSGDPRALAFFEDVLRR